jgi:hypothetical protein
LKQEQEVNPVEIWEGIDTREETGRNRLTKLAIHILSVVANSAGCERAFSHMGLVHTAIRSKLSIEKVRKATIVGMDLKRMHTEAGLLRTQAKRSFNFGSEAQKDAEPSVDSDDQDLGDINDPLDFDQLSERLIAGAASASGDKDVGDVDASDDSDELPSTIMPVPPLTITIPPLNSATRSVQSNTLAPVIVSIPLRILFKYPPEKDPPSDGMNTFWRGGIQNLDRELEAYDLLSGSREPGDSLAEDTTTTEEINPEISDNMNY